MDNLAFKIADTIRAVFGKPNKSRRTAAVIVAGGNSTRMGDGVSKQMLLLDGIPVVVHTLLAFEKAKTVSSVVVVAKADEIQFYREYKETFGLKKLLKVVPGGETRQESAKKGFEAIPEDAEFAAIHDAARCLITPEEIDEVVRAAYSFGAAIAALRASETVKVGENGFIRETIDRDRVYLARTPQVFGTDLYRAALAIAERDGITVTDDSALVEHIEHRVKLVGCSSHNIKITTKEDIPVAAAILASRKSEETEK